MLNPGLKDPEAVHEECEFIPIVTVISGRNDKTVDFLQVTGRKDFPFGTTLDELVQGDPAFLP